MSSILLRLEGRLRSMIGEETVEVVVEHHVTVVELEALLRTLYPTMHGLLDPEQPRPLLRYVVNGRKLWASDVLTDADVVHVYIADDAPQHLDGG